MRTPADMSANISSWRPRKFERGEQPRPRASGGNHVDEPPSVSVNIAAYGPHPGTVATASGAAAQELQDLKKPATPLVLQSQGSFTVGGDIVVSDALGTGGSGHIAVNQMFVQYMIRPSSLVAVVMVHGADLSGKSYETTPDGRMGWEEYFVRKRRLSPRPRVAGEIGVRSDGLQPSAFRSRFAGRAAPHLPIQQ